MPHPHACFMYMLFINIFRGFIIVIIVHFVDMPFQKLAAKCFCFLYAMTFLYSIGDWLNENQIILCDVMYICTQDKEKSDLFNVYE